MTNHGALRRAALIKGAVFAFAMAATIAGVAQAQPQGPTRAGINGAWVDQNITYEEGPESNMTANFTTTPWAPLSAGRPEDVKFEALDVQRARSRKTVEDNVDIFAARRDGPNYLSPAGEKAMAEVRAARAEAAKSKKASPYDRCLPANSFTVFGGNSEIFTANGHMGVLTDAGYRAIHLSKDKSKYTPDYTGISVARWEGDRLIVETSDWLGETVNNWPPSEKAKLTETLWIDAKGVLNIKAVYEDPINLKEPVARMMYLRRSSTPVADVEFHPQNCVANIQGAAEFDALFGGPPVQASNVPPPAAAAPR